jgi:hypothetical protein
MEHSEIGMGARRRSQEHGHLARDGKCYLQKGFKEITGKMPVLLQSNLQRLTKQLGGMRLGSFLRGETLSVKNFSTLSVEFC